jgi:hypothetical protein
VDCFPEFNAGVLLFRKLEQTEWFLERWAQIYAEDSLNPLTRLFPGGASLYRKAIPNQPSFRRAIYESGLRIATLPPECNCRVPFPVFLHTNSQNYSWSYSFIPQNCRGIKQHHVTTCLSHALGKTQDVRKRHASREKYFVSDEMVTTPLWNPSDGRDDNGPIHDEILENLYMIGPASIR